MKFLISNELSVTPREIMALFLAVISFCGSLAFGYGTKAAQLTETQTIVIRHDGAIRELSQELVLLRIAVAELNGSISKLK